MRRRSLTGPLLLLVVGFLFLWRNLNPEARIFDLVALYWPFLLIVWGVMRAVEVLVWRRDGYRMGLSGGEVVLIVFICLIGSGMWQARQHGVNLGGIHVFGQEMWGQQFDYPISARASAAGIKRIVIDNPRGNVRVTGADTQEVTVTGRKVVRAYAQSDADKTDSSTPVEIVTEGDRLLVRTNQDRARQGQRLTDDLEIAVPRAFSVEGRSSRGDYEVSDVSGDVEISSGNSDVRLSHIGGKARLDIERSSIIRASDVSGAIDLRGSGSDIDLENVMGQVTISGSYRGTLDFKNLAKPLQVEGVRDTELRVQAVPGHISMDLSQLSANNLVGPVRLVSRSRDIRLEQFTESLVVETERGDVELVPRATPLPSMDIRAGSGRIDLELPLNSAFQLEATAQVGDAVNDFGPVIQKEVSGRTAKLSGKAGNGPNLRLQTERGWISVRREGAASSAPPDEDEPEKRGRPRGAEI